MARGMNELSDISTSLPPKSHPRPRKGSRDRRRSRSVSIASQMPFADVEHYRNS